MLKVRCFPFLVVFDCVFFSHGISFHVTTWSSLIFSFFMYFENKLRPSYCIASKNSTKSNSFPLNAPKENASVQSLIIESMKPSTHTLEDLCERILTTTFEHRGCIWLVYLENNWVPLNCFHEKRKLERLLLNYTEKRKLRWAKLYNRHLVYANYTQSNTTKDWKYETLSIFCGQEVQFCEKIRMNYHRNWLQWKSCNQTPLKMVKIIFFSISQVKELQPNNTLRSVISPYYGFPLHIVLVCFIFLQRS